MADDRQDTPEKQLLRLIEGAKSSEGAAKGGRAPKGVGARPAFSLGALAGRASYFLRAVTAKRPAGFKPSGPRITLGLVNQLLALTVFALFVYVAGDAVASSMQLSRPVNLTPKGETVSGATAPAPQGLNDSAYYLQKISARDIFREAGKAVEKKAEVSDEPLSAEENPATSGLSLVGISWSANPDCIIEDKEKKRTYFVKRGQALSDGVKVEAIFKDRVVLSHEGREFELR